MHWESGQAAVEWVALVLLAALVLGAGAALAGHEPDRGLGEVVAKRIAGGPRGLELAGAPAAAGAAPTPRAAVSPAPGARARATPRASAPAAAPTPAAAPAPTRRGPAPPAAPAPASGVADDMRGIRGIGSVARHAWIGCLGYQRWRYEREHPIAAIEGLPVGEALGIVNDCINPHAYLFED